MSLKLSVPKPPGPCQCKDVMFTSAEIAIIEMRLFQFPNCPIFTSKTASWYWILSWRRHEMDTVSALLAICAWNSPVPGEFPAQRPVTRSFDVFFVLRLNKRLSKQSWGWWFETPSRPWLRHRNAVMGIPRYHDSWQNMWRIQHYIYRSVFIMPSTYLGNPSLPPSFRL